MLRLKVSTAVANVNGDVDVETFGHFFNAGGVLLTVPLRVSGEDGVGANGGGFAAAALPGVADVAPGGTYACC